MTQKQPIHVTFKDAKAEFTITCSTVKEMQAAYEIIKDAAQPRRAIVSSGNKDREKHERIARETALSLD